MTSPHGVGNLVRMVNLVNPKHDLIVGAKREASPSVRRRDAPDASGRLTSFSTEARGSRVLPRSS